MRSMTGYGDAVSETPDFVLSIDVKAVNNRFLKINSKISDEVNFLQIELEEVARKRLARGSIFFTIRF
ncbi:MAG: YicC family protein, partial [Planctomycetes bacterium]|nr:YicC family protein [Planctomycetota bacterium]